MRGIILIAIVFVLLCTVVTFTQTQSYCQRGDISDDFTLNPTAVVVPIGGNTTISCLYRPDASEAEIIWGVVRGGIPSFLFNGTNGILMSADGKALIFNNVEQTHEASYYCYITVSQTEEICSNLVPLTILHVPVITNQDKPMGVAVFEYNLTVRTQAMLNLRTGGSPTPETVLFKKMDGSYIEVTSERFTVNLLGVTISSVEPEDVGEYRLTATYENHYDEEEFTIFVNIPPVPPALELEVLSATAADNARVLAHIGSRVSITCMMTEAYTDGNLQVHWSTDSQLSNLNTVKTSSTEVELIIDDATREHNGRYTCHAINNQGNTMKSVNIVVGAVPEPLSIMAYSSNNTLIVMWEQNTTEDYDQQITAHYVQYISINNSNNVVVVEKFADSVQFATFKNVDHNVEYLVTMWSENAFGNGSVSNEVSVVITGATEDIPISTGLPLSTNVPKSNSSANGSNIFIITGAIVGFIVLLIIIIALLCFAMLWRSQRRILSMDAKAYCTTNELNTNNLMYDVIGHPLYDVADHPLYDVIEPNVADNGTTTNKVTISYPSYNAPTNPYSKTSEEECSYEQPYGGLDEVKMNTDPAYAVTARRDWSKTNKEGCDHVQVNESMLCEPNAVDIQPTTFIQHEDLNGSAKMNTDPAYAGLSTREDRALTLSAITMHSNTKPHQPPHDTRVTVEQYDDSDACGSTAQATHKIEGTID